MANPLNALTFVGPPDWRSALLAALFALPWLVALGRSQLRGWQTWAAVLFRIGIALVQAPIEQGLNLLWLRLLDTATIERLFAVPFHTGSTALAGYGYVFRRPWHFLLLAIALHSPANYGGVLLQLGLLSVAGIGVWAALVAAATAGLAFWLHRRAVRPPVEDGRRRNTAPPPVYRSLEGHTALHRSTMRPQGAQAVPV